MQRQSVRNLPSNTNPTGTRCIQIIIPDDDEWERDLYGEVWRLTRWMLWERDLTKSGKPVADRWLKAISTWSHCDDSPTPPFHPGIEEDEEMPITVDCDCNVFYNCPDGTQGQLPNMDQVQNMINQPGGPDSPGGGAPQPTPGGGCASYHGTLIGSQQWVVPTPVSTGDTIEASGFAGATNLTGDPFWFGPNGLLYFAGQYQPKTGAVFAGNPVPAELTQGLVVKLQGNYYSLIDGVFTVPSGVNNEQPVILLNTDVPGDLSGSVNFDLKVCNNGAANISIMYSHGSGPTTVDFGSTIIATAADIGSDVRLEMTFSTAIKLTVENSSGYVNVGTPGPSNQWGFIQLGTTTIVLLADPPDTDPTDTPEAIVCTGLVFTTAGPSAVFSVALRLAHP
jgi:hypothetical protein